MKIKIYQVDAFASEVFEGNPAAVCPLESWLPDETLQKIAEENNLSETAFFVFENDSFSLRWFTPEDEVDLCGHATLAAAHVIFKHLEYSEQIVKFQTRSGELHVEKSGLDYCMNFPASLPKPTNAPRELLEGLGVTPKQVLSAFDYVVVLKDEAELKSVNPDFIKLSQVDLRGVIITAQGVNVDFVSRCFFPKLRVNEDPVTGSAHCELAPFWSRELGKTTLIGRQLSNRTGIVNCTLIEDRVELKGRAIDYLEGEISIK